MAETERTVAELLTIFEDGQPEGSITEQDLRDYVVSASVFDTEKTIKVEADFPTPILAPDGVMRIPLDITVSYNFDVGELEVATPFLMPERLSGFERVRFFSPTNTTFIYTGTDSLFWGRNSSSLEIDKVDFVADTPGTICFDMVAGPNVVNFTLFNTAIIDFDTGFVSGYGVFGRRLGIDRSRGPFHIHNAPRCLIDNLRISSDISGAIKPNFLFTGGDETTLTVIENVLSEILNAGQSHVAVDSGFVAKQTSFQNFGFNDDGGSFFETELTGAISAFADLAGLITGSSADYTQYLATTEVLVTDVGHDAYVGLQVNHTGTTNYNGQHTVLRVLGNDQYVMDATYVGDELGVGSYTGIGTRVTTTAPHKLNNHRATAITGTTNYNGTGLEVLNAVSPDFDITTPFVADDATGTYSTTSLTETSTSVFAANNGDLPDSKKTGEVDLSVPITVLDTGSADSFKLIGGTNWTTVNTEQFTANSAGELVYVGVNATTFAVSGNATIEKDGGGSAVLALRIAKEDVTIPTSEGATQNSTPTQVSSLAVITLEPGEKVALFVQNTGDTNDVIVNLATLLVSGM